MQQDAWDAWGIDPMTIMAAAGGALTAVQGTITAATAPAIARKQAEAARYDALQTLQAGTAMQSQQIQAALAEQASTKRAVLFGGFGLLGVLALVGGALLVFRRRK